MKCAKCETNLANGAKFCAECGTPAPKPEPKPPEQKQYPPIMTVNQTAELLRVSRCQIYVLIKNDDLPWFPVGTRKRFITDEVIAWSKSRQVFGEIDQAV
jgi:excisionase family DNA binding protein